ncbi:MAG TPA: glycosyltransferase [Candidatus Baltobacteraceae bacterium]
MSVLRLPSCVTSVERRTISGNFVPAQRELILRHALTCGADFVAMIDDDMVLPPDALQRLCDAILADPTVALVGALYYSRDGLRPMAVANWDPGRTTSANTPGFDGTTPVTVDGVGFGCVLVRASALRDLPQPFLRTHVYIEEVAGRVRVCDEDYLFCETLRAAGHHVLLHSGVRCGHFDRSSERTFPERWEEASVTRGPRMMIRRPDGTPALVAADSSLGEAGERHVPASIEYIYPTEHR